VRLAQCRFKAIEAYRRLSMEREAYAEMYNKTYLHERRPFAWMKFVK
jgi:hypothetical protein